MAMVPPEAKDLAAEMLAASPQMPNEELPERRYQRVDRRLHKFCAGRFAIRVR
jgi:hypothetical protein